MKKINLFIVLLLALGLFSCKKDYLETKPSNGIEESIVLAKSLSSITGSLEGTYKQLFGFGAGGSTRHDDYGQKSIDLQADLMGNDIVVHSQGYGWYNADYRYTSWGSKVNTSQSDQAWTFYYDIIKQVNKILKYVDVVPDATVADKEKLKGQALGLRAYGYYYLVNLMQQTYKGNETKPGVTVVTNESPEGEKGRGTVQEVYNQIISDLTNAETFLNGKSRSSKVNMDVSVVQGFRARVALLMEDWATAATYANRAKQGYTLMTQAEYTPTNAFSDITNPEWMWGALISDAEATIYASFFSHMDIRTGGYAALGGQKKITKALYDQIPVGDVRRSVFKVPGGSSPNVAYNQLKFQVPDAGSWAADYLFMRASEMYLIEAEALARQNQDAAARSVLETMVKARNPAYSAAGFSGQALIDEILLQRRIELWGEGFALIDIKRLNQGLNRPTGPGNHGTPSLDPIVYTTGPADPRFLMRIPQRQLDTSPYYTAADQNP